MNITFSEIKIDEWEIIMNRAGNWTWSCGTGYSFNGRPPS